MPKFEFFSQFKTAFSAFRIFFILFLNPESPYYVTIKMNFYWASFKKIQWCGFENYVKSENLTKLSHGPNYPD